MTNANTKLLMSIQTKRYFLVPVDRSFAPGSFIVHSIQGKKGAVAEADLKPFEVSKAQARAWLEDETPKWLSAQIDHVVKNVKQAGIDYFHRFEDWLKESGPPTASASAPTRADLLLEELRKIFDTAEAPTEEEAPQARAWARAVKSTAARHGENPPDDLEKSADPLQQLLDRLNQADARAESAANLLELAQRVEATGAVAADRLRDLARTLTAEAAPGETVAPIPQGTVEVCQVGAAGCVSPATEVAPPAGAVVAAVSIAHSVGPASDESVAPSTLPEESSTEQLRAEMDVVLLEVDIEETSDPVVVPDPESDMEDEPPAPVVPKPAKRKALPPTVEPTSPAHLLDEDERELLTGRQAQRRRLWLAVVLAALLGMAGLAGWIYYTRW